MFGFKSNKVDENLLEEKCLNILKSHFEKWLQNTYEALSCEQLECVSKYAKEIYNINDEELAKIIETRPSKYFTVRETPIPSPSMSRGKRREMKVCDDACLMDKKEMDSILLKWAIDGKEYQTEAIVIDSSKKYTLGNKKVEDILLEQNKMKHQIRDIIDNSRNNKLSITEVENMLEEILGEN